MRRSVAMVKLVKPKVDVTHSRDLVVNARVAGIDARPLTRRRTLAFIVTGICFVPSAQ